MVCATARRAPIKAYFELDAHPDPKIVYTVRLEIARINSKPRFRLIIECGSGSGIHIRRARAKATVGVAKNKNGEDADGRTGSLINNFRPSAIG